MSTKNERDQKIFLQYADIGIISHQDQWGNDFGINLDESVTEASYYDTEKLIKLATELEISPNLATLSKEYPKNWEDETGLKAFISHRSNIKDSAHRLKNSLKSHNISGFVAHDDIAPAREWQEQIEKALNTMDIFISIHCKDYSQSEWCQQEMGFAIARNVDIIPIKGKTKNGDILPNGFAGKIQAMTPKNLNDLTNKIVNTVRESKKIGKLYNTSINPLPVQINANYDDEIPF